MSGKILKNIWENTSQLVTVVLLEGSARVGSEEGNRDFFYIYSQNIFLMFFSYIKYFSAWEKMLNCVRLHSENVHLVL